MLKLPAGTKTWNTYRSQIVGILLRYPLGWATTSLDHGLGVALYPSGSGPQVPGPRISIVFDAHSIYGTHSLQTPYATKPSAITVDGVRGRRYRDRYMALPSSDTYVDLPYHHGAILAVATLGPDVNLTNALDRILKTTRLEP